LKKNKDLKGNDHHERKGSENITWKRIKESETVQLIKMEGDTQREKRKKKRRKKGKEVDSQPFPEKKCCLIRRKDFLRKGFAVHRI